MTKPDQSAKRSELAIATAMLLGAEFCHDQFAEQRNYPSWIVGSGGYFSGPAYRTRGEAAIMFLGARGIGITHDCVVYSFKRNNP
jgi:hypothetical protein